MEVRSTGMRIGSPLIESISVSYANCICRSHLNSIIVADIAHSNDVRIIRHGTMRKALLSAFAVSFSFAISV